jgi:asparagine synthase (glutamine-hydrolysing)
MCGIAGYYGLNKNEALLRRMNAAQAHRGPDGEGYFCDEVCGLAHLRLAIIDRKGGAQPIYTADKQLSIIYNGELYNYRQLRAELQDLGHTFTTDSDTEVILQSYAQWGENCFDRFNGMFAVAIYDLGKKHLVLARDHFGIKPLYFARPKIDSKNALVFASEIKAILASGLVEAKANDKAVYRYLRFRAHEDTGETFFDGVFKLMPGELMVVSEHGVTRRHYTRLPEQLLKQAKHPRPYNEAEIEKYRSDLAEAIRSRLVGEVSVGTCLSGGMDSSVVALTVNHLLAEKDVEARSVGTVQNTFSAVFPGSVNDEERYIDEVIAKAGKHIVSHRIKPTADSFAEDLEDFIRTQEEPTISTGPYAQYKVMQEAAKHVTVLLDGQGADEMMAGYYPYYFVRLRELARDGRWLKLGVEAALGSGVLLRAVRFKLYAKLSFKQPVGVLGLMNADFRRAHASERFKITQNDLKKRFVEDIFVNSLPALLRYEDKNTMRWSLEGRVPFLDKDVMMSLFGLSNDGIIHGSWNKRVLRDASRGLLPETIRRRRNKIGFTTPENEWFYRLKTRFYGILTSESFGSRPYFDQQAVVAAFEGYVAGHNSADTMMFWRLLNVELWLREFIDPKPEPGVVAARAVVKGPFEANEERKLDIRVDGAVWRRYPLRTPEIKATDQLTPLVVEAVDEFMKLLAAAPAEHREWLKRPWRLFISEKIVAITQGRSYFIWDIKAGFWARTLSKRVVKTPTGIGLGSPWTMQLAIQEAGLPRILLATVGSVVGKLVGRRGLFYQLAGANVRAIDGPTEYSVYPSNVSAKLPPADPAQVAARLSAALRKKLPAELAANFHGTVVIDANDIGRNVLGQDSDLPAATLEAAFGDNPLGQGRECTPLAVVFESQDALGQVG